MKAKIIVIAAIVGLTMGFQVAADKSTATVDQMQGLYVFIQSKPKADFEYLGTVKKSIALTGKPQEMLNSMVKKVKNDYPQADGIIFTSVDMYKADAVKFK